jgi:hypothetical protein
VVFPNPEPPKPELPDSVSDSFSETTLKNWDTSKATATWGVVNKQVTAITTDKEIDHYLLPLLWREERKPKHYELTVDVNVYGSEGLGGLFFNGSDSKANVVFISKDRVTLAQVNDAKKEEVDVIASGSYKLRNSNRLKVVVKDDDVSIYLNGQFVFTQRMKLEGTKLGLYLHKEAMDELPAEITYLDNFTFKAVE